MMLSQRGNRNKLTGIVVSSSPNKTAVVKTTLRVKHVKYKKFIQKDSRHFIHDSKNQCSVGDKVLFCESRPYSKNKKWRLVEILEKAAG